MFDASQHRKLAEWVNKSSRQLNDRLAKARSQEDLRAVLADATGYHHKLRTERESHALALAEVLQRLEQDRPLQQDANPGETAAELRQDVEIRKQVIAELDRHIAVCEAFIEWVQEELSRQIGGVLDGAPQDALKGSIRSYLKRHSEWQIISAGIGLAIVILAAGALLAQSRNSPAPSPAIPATAATVPVMATDLVATASELAAPPRPAATPEPTATLEPTATPGPTATPEPSSTPEPTATPEPSSTPEPTATPGPTATPVPAPIAADAANLRGGPGTNYPVLDTIRAGQTLDIVARTATGDWYRLRNGGWIAAFLVANPPGEVPEASGIPTPPAQPSTATSAPG